MTNPSPVADQVADPVIDRIFREGRTLQRGQLVMEGLHHEDDFRAEVRNLLGERGTPQTTDEYVVTVAMGYAVGTPYKGPIILPDHEPKDGVGPYIGLAWTEWALGRHTFAHEALEGTLYWLRRADLRCSGMGRFALELWGGAVEKTLEGNLPEARILGARATEVTTLYGLEVGDMIRWTLLATQLGPDQREAPDPYLGIGGRSVGVP